MNWVKVDYNTLLAVSGKCVLFSGREWCVACIRLCPNSRTEYDLTPEYGSYGFEFLISYTLFELFSNETKMSSLTSIVF